MQKTLVALALAAGFAAPVLAEDAPASPHTISPNVGVVSDYLFRGISQTQGRPAIQGGIDYSHSSGLYVGVWGSNVSWIRATDISDHSAIETDLYGGYKATFGDFGVDVGGIRYYYPKGRINSPLVTPDTSELYVGGSWKFISLKYSHTVSDYMVGWTSTTGGKTAGSNYTDLTITYPINDKINLIGHIGRQNIKNFSYASYTDWKLGATYDTGYGVVGLAYSDTNAKTCGDTPVAAYCWGTTSPKDVAKGKAVLSYTKTF